MRSFFNLLTILFVIGSIYYVTRTNNISELAAKYFNQASSTIQNFTHNLPQQLTDLSNSLTSPTVSPAGESGNQTQKISTTPSVALPGPLKQIDTAIKNVISIPKSASTSALTIKGIIAETNKQRTSLSFKPLTESAQLDASAKIKANDILAKQYFEHISPDGKSVTNLVADQGYTYIKIGENLALGNFASDKDVVDAWMGSPGHRANILDPEFVQIGVGVAYGLYQGHYAYVAVQHFGRPSSDCPSVNNQSKIEIQSKQSDQSVLLSTLENLKIQIDQGRAQSQNVDSLVQIYNQGVIKYNALSAQIEALIAAYNAQVDAFNSCIHSL